MKKLYFALDLKDDPELIRNYIEHHQNVWPGILKSISITGIIDMEIYHVGNRLFMILKTEDSFDLEAKAEADRNNPTVQKWELLMDQYQKYLPFAKKGEKWVRMTRIFSLKKSLTDNNQDQ